MDNKRRGTRYQIKSHQVAMRRKWRFSARPTSFMASLSSTASRTGDSTSSGIRHRQAIRAGDSQRSSGAFDVTAAATDLFGTRPISGMQLSRVGLLLRKQCHWPEPTALESIIHMGQLRVLDCYALRRLNCRDNIGTVNPINTCCRGV